MTQREEDIMAACDKAEAAANMLLNCLSRIGELTNANRQVPERHLWGELVRWLQGHVSYTHDGLQAIRRNLAAGEYHDEETP